MHMNIIIMIIIITSINILLLLLFLLFMIIRIIIISIICIAGLSRRGWLLLHNLKAKLAAGGGYFLLFL